MLDMSLGECYVALSGYEIEQGQLELTDMPVSLYFVKVVKDQSLLIESLRYML